MNHLVRITHFTLLFIALILSAPAARATQFYAQASGNFNSGAVWNTGVAPGPMINGDTVTIPAGITVTLTTTVTFTGASSLLVNGSFKTIPGAGLVLLSGVFDFGNIFREIDSMVIGGPIAYFNFGGKCKHLTSYGNKTFFAGGIIVDSTLNLMADTLNAGNIIFQGKKIEVSGGHLVGTFLAPAYYELIYNTVSTFTGAELADYSTGKITINVPGTVTLSRDFKIRDTLNLVSGNLVLNDHHFTFDSTSNFIRSSGNISSSARSDISVASHKSLTDRLSFLSGHDTVRNLLINTKTAAVTVPVGSHMVVNGALSLRSGKIDIAGDDILVTHADSIKDASDSSYVMMSGTGKLSAYVPANDTAAFPVGTGQHYAPLVISDNTGTVSSVVSVNVTDKVYTDGTGGFSLAATQPLVNATWHVSSNVTSGISYNMLASWGSGLEVNGFDRTQAYISHYTSNAWDKQPTAPAVGANGRYTLARKNITSLSPFAVVDATTKFTGIHTLSLNNVVISLYPNPAINELYVNSTAKFSTVIITDIAGHVVRSVALANNSFSVSGLQTGYYIAHLYGENIQATQKFMKR